MTVNHKIKIRKIHIFEPFVKTCIGYQETLGDMRAHRSEIVLKYRKNPGHILYRLATFKFGASDLQRSTRSRIKSHLRKNNLKIVPIRRRNLTRR